MRGKRAKAIRREIYGDLSPYVRMNRVEKNRGHGYRMHAGSLRRRYQAAKRDGTRKPAPRSKTRPKRIRPPCDQANFETLTELKARQRERRARETE